MIDIVEKVIAFNDVIKKGDIQKVAEIGFDSLKSKAIKSANYNIEFHQNELNRVYLETGKYDLKSQIGIAFNSLYSNDLSRNVILYSFNWKSLLYFLTKDYSCK